MHEIGAGRRQMPVSEGRNHHVVPQFVLSRFATPPRKKGVLYELNRRTGANQRVSVKEATALRDFYAVASTEAARDNRIEAFLGLAESHAAPAIEKLLSDSKSTDEFDQIDIALFLTLQTQRTPLAREFMGEFIQTAAETYLRKQVSDPDAFARAMVEAGADLTAGDLERNRKELLRALDDGRLHNTNLHEEGWRLTIDTFLEAAEAPLRMTWLMLRAREGEFVVSDEGFAAVPLDDGGTETSFPLSPDACLLLGPGRPGTFAELDIDRDDVDTINLRTYGWANRLVFGRSQAEVTRVRRLAKRDPRRVPKRPTAHERLGQFDWDAVPS